MGLDTALSIASGGLANINAQFGVLSQNVTNAATPGYSAEVSNQQALDVGGVGMGVRTLPTTLQIDQTLQSSVVQQNGVVSGGQRTQAALQAIDSVLGTPGAGNDVGSLLGNLQNGFSTLMIDPSNQTQQSAVVASATTLAQGVNTLSSAYSTQRQAAQDDLGSALDSMNTTLATLGQISGQIMSLKSSGQSTADLENQRNEEVQSLSQLVDVKTVEQPNGDLSVFTGSGMTLSTGNGASPYSMPNASTPAGSYYPGGGIPGITLKGVDVTSQLTGGRIGADIALRDTILPTSQAELDEFSQGISSRFASQGLTLFTDPTGNVPAAGGTPAQAGYVGYSSTIQVNPAITANPSLVRDGTNATASFTPNPTGGPAGFTGLISNIVNYTFGIQSQSGVSQPDMNTTGLGAAGNLAASFSGAGASLSQFATRLVSSQAQQSATTTSNLTSEQALQSSLNSKVSAVSSVNMDTEMSQMLVLQQAYSANGKIIAAVQSMFTQLLQAVQ